MRKPKLRISVDKLYYALVLSDTEEGTTYSAPIWLQGVNSVSYNPNTQTQSYDADGGTYESYSADGDIQTTITVADLLPEHYAALMGLQHDVNGVVTEDSVSYTHLDVYKRQALGYMTACGNRACRASSGNATSGGVAGKYAATIPSRWRIQQV